MNFFHFRSETFEHRYEMKISVLFENNCDKSVMVLRYFPRGGAVF
jgi:hypothetical protein